MLLLSYSPRVWRWSWSSKMSLGKTTVFSTSVEVIPKGYEEIDTNPGILHECGGDPEINTQAQSQHEYSPRVWRWSCFFIWDLNSRIVFSTSVEVILLLIMIIKDQSSILHECGGDPQMRGAWQKLEATSILHECGGDPGSLVAFEPGYKYSPRVWRWS